MRDTSAAGLEATIREYFDGCNEANIEKMMRCWTSDGVHYFPAGAPQGPFEGWVAAVEKLGSRWTIDRVLVDAERLEAVIEWTHFKPTQGVYLRGDEWYIFSDDGLIKEIRAYYACPPPQGEIRSHELGDFAYEQRGYPTSPPEVNR
jgi:hypothetical protein